MSKIFARSIVIVSMLTLTGCINQPQADKKMGEGCKGAISAMIEPKTLKEVKSLQFMDDHTEGSVYRRINVTAIEKHGWMELEKQYSCLFSQEWGIFRSSHAALLEQISYDGTMIGKKNGKIIGTIDDFIKLTKSADTAMAQ